jgi:DNA end-binding protein Ku
MCGRVRLDNDYSEIKEDHYESALQGLLQKKQAGQPLPKLTSRTSGNVIDIMDALRASLKDGKSPPSKATKPAPKKAAKAKPAAKRKAG